MTRLNRRTSSETLALTFEVWLQKELRAKNRLYAKEHPNYTLYHEPAHDDPPHHVPEVDFEGQIWSPLSYLFLYFPWALKVLVDKHFIRWARSVCERPFGGHVPCAFCMDNHLVHVTEMYQKPSRLSVLVSKFLLYDQELMATLTFTWQGARIKEIDMLTTFNMCV